MGFIVLLSIFNLFEKNNLTRSSTKNKISSRSFEHTVIQIIQCRFAEYFRTDNTFIYEKSLFRRREPGYTINKVSFGVKRLEKIVAVDRNMHGEIISLQTSSRRVISLRKALAEMTAGTLEPISGLEMANDQQLMSLASVQDLFSDLPPIY